MPKLDVTFVVICRADSKYDEHIGERISGTGDYELATRRVFPTEDEARTYARTINQSREPLVIPGDWLHLRETAVPGEEEPPRFTHDCSTCVYLGRIQSEPGAHASEREGYDLYFHKEGHVTVIARFGSEGPDYVSGLPLADKVPALAEAKRRAIQRGLLRS